VTVLSHELGSSQHGARKHVSWPFPAKNNHTTSELKGCLLRTRFILGDQLDRADAGSWQIADGGDTGSSSSLRRRALAGPRTVRALRFSTTGADTVIEQDQGERARATRSWCLRATRPAWPRVAVNMLDEERRCKRHPGAASMAAPRLCAPLPAALPEPQSSQILRHACAQPAAQ